MQFLQFSVILEKLDFGGKIWYNTRSEQRKEQKNADQYTE